MSMKFPMDKTVAFSFRSSCDILFLAFLKLYIIAQKKIA